VRKIIRVLGYRYGDNDSASTRIRFNRALNAMKDIELEVTTSGFSSERPDVLYIQKRADSVTLSLAHEAKKQGIPVVYDIDDAPGQCASTTLENTMMELASIVTVDTDEKLIAFSHIPSEKIAVVPDCLDYFDIIPSKAIVPGIQKIITFGREHSIQAAHPLIESVKQSCKGIMVYYISDNYVPLMDGLATWVLWNMDVIKRYLLSADLAILGQTEDARGNMRSNNRLIACMAAGLPVVVNDSSNFRKTMIHAEYKDMIVNPATISDMIFTLGAQSRRAAISENIQKFAWTYYSPEYIAEKFRKVFERAINGTQ